MLTRATAELENAAPFRDEEFEIPQVFRMKKSALCQPICALLSQFVMQSADFILPIRHRKTRAMASAPSLFDSGSCRVLLHQKQTKLSCSEGVGWLAF